MDYRNNIVSTIYMQLKNNYNLTIYLLRVTRITHRFYSSFIMLDNNIIINGKPRSYQRINKLHPLHCMSTQKLCPLQLIATEK